MPRQMASHPGNTLEGKGQPLLPPQFSLILHRTSILIPMLINPILSWTKYKSRGDSLVAIPNWVLAADCRL